MPTLPQERHHHSHCPFIEEEEDEVEGEEHCQVEGLTYIIDSDEEDDACFCQAMHLMSKKHKKDVVTPSMVTLDAGLPASVFCNQDLLERIGDASKTLCLMTNVGEMRDKKMGM